MNNGIEALATDLREKHRTVVRLQQDGKPVLPILKEMWLVSERIEAEAHHTLLRAQILAKLLRDHVNECEAGPAIQKNQSFDAVVEHAFHNPDERYFLSAEGSGFLRHCDLTAAIDSLMVPTAE